MQALQKEYNKFASLARVDDPSTARLVNGQVDDPPLEPFTSSESPAKPITASGVHCPKSAERRRSQGRTACNWTELSGSAQSRLVMTTVRGLGMGIHARHVE